MSNHSMSFWDFSKLLYDQDHVASACLSLQDDYGLDVNLILYAYWFGEAYGEMSPSVLQEALEFSAAWNAKVVQALRGARRWMKANSATLPEPTGEDFFQLRESIKERELAAERYQQNTLQLLAERAEPSPFADDSLAAAAHNLKLLTQACRVKMDAKLTGAFERIDQAFVRIQTG